MMEISAHNCSLPFLLFRTVFISLPVVQLSCHSRPKCILLLWKNETCRTIFSYLYIYLVQNPDPDYLFTADNRCCWISLFTHCDVVNVSISFFFVLCCCCVYFFHSTYISIFTPPERLTSDYGLNNDNIFCAEQSIITSSTWHPPFVLLLCHFEFIPCDISLFIHSHFQ